MTVSIAGCGTVEALDKGQADQEAVDANHPPSVLEEPFSDSFEAKRIISALTLCGRIIYIFNTQLISIVLLCFMQPYASTPLPPVLLVIARYRHHQMNFAHLSTSTC